MTTKTLKYQVTNISNVLIPTEDGKSGHVMGAVSIQPDVTMRDALLKQLIKEGFLADWVDISDFMLDGDVREMFLTVHKTGMPVLQLLLLPESSIDCNVTSENIFSNRPDGILFLSHNTRTTVILTVVYGHDWRVRVQREFEHILKEEKQLVGIKMSMRFKYFWDAWNRVSHLASYSRQMGYNVRIAYKVSHSKSGQS